MRVLFLSPREAWPAKSGARLRDYHFARSLASRFELTYIFFSGDPARSELGPHLPQAKCVVPVASPSKYTPTKILKGLLSNQPLPVQNYTSPEMSSAIESALRSEPFDIVHLDSIHLAGYLDTIRQLAPQARTVLDWHNVESELMQRYSATSSSLPRRMYARMTAGSLQRLESVMLKDCFGHVVCSEREQQELLARRPQARVVVIENGVDTAPQPRVASTANPGHELVFVGQMSYHANIEAIVWFVQEIWPAVRERHPQFTLSIVGSDPAPEVMALGSREGIRVSGTVPEVLPYYQNAFASIAPLRSGGGTRLKILEAMAVDTPVISTALGAEGLDVTDGSNILLVGCGVGSWLAAIDIAMGPRRAELVANARQLVCERYDWSTIGDRLADLYRSWVRE